MKGFNSMDSVTGYDLSSLPFIDDHSHPYIVTPEGDRYTALDTFLGVVGSHDPAALAHRDAMLYQRWATRTLARFLDCDPTPAAVAAARKEAGDERSYRERLFADQRIEGLVVDTGYPFPLIDVDRFLRETPAPVARLFRIEVLIRQLLDQDLSWAELRDRFDGAIRAAIRERGFAGVKSIIAYRTGLDVDIANLAESAGEAGLAAARQAPDDMMASKPLRDHLLGRTAALAGELNVPFQIHTGFGDAEIVLTRCNPANLNRFLAHSEHAATRFVLVHTYPFMAEAAFLAAALPNVWCDLSLGIPFAPAAADRVLETALELAPTNRLLAGSDAFSGPEQTWLGAVLTREALGRVLAGLEQRDLITESEAGEIAADLLAGNARSLYSFS
jgi:predicted TIM-barrel fold metal-dependent hydrolase